MELFRDDDSGCLILDFLLDGFLFLDPFRRVVRMVLGMRLALIWLATLA